MLFSKLGHPNEYPEDITRCGDRKIRPTLKQATSDYLAVPNHLLISFDTDCFYSAVK
jgi:hypothetical protein